MEVGNGPTNQYIKTLAIGLQWLQDGEHQPPPQTFHLPLYYTPNQHCIKTVYTQWTTKHHWQNKLSEHAS